MEKKEEEEEKKEEEKEEKKEEEVENWCGTGGREKTKALQEVLADLKRVYFFENANVLNFFSC